jgi:hypothetical protein
MTDESKNLIVQNIYGDLIRKSLADWRAEGEKLFGPHGRDWKFKCSMCGHIQCGQDFVNAGQTPEQAMSRVHSICIGRLVKGVGCDWSLHGLFQLHTVEVITGDGIVIPVFDFYRTPTKEVKPT